MPHGPAPLSCPAPVRRDLAHYRIVSVHTSFRNIVVLVVVVVIVVIVVVEIFVMVVASPKWWSGLRLRLRLRWSQWWWSYINLIKSSFKLV